jgi:Tfp pilus assembly protein PilN
MSFTIDLLQGKGLPQRSRPGTIALAAVPFLIPVLASGLLAARWYHHSTLIAAERAVLLQNQQHIDHNTQVLREYETVQQKILEARHNIKNITDALAYEMPASPILLELVQALPPTVFMQKLDLDYQPLRQKVVNPQSNQVTYQRTIQRTLRLTLAGPNQIDTDQAVDNYIQTLRSLPFLSRAAKEIQITSRQETEVDKQIFIFYEIRCPLIDQK